jgi:AraC-like DNA-binding protein
MSPANHEPAAGGRANVADSCTILLDELRGLILAHARPDMTTALDGVLLSRVEAVTPQVPSMTGTVLALIVQGRKRLAVGDAVHEYGPGEYVVASVDLPVTGGFVAAPALGFGLVLRPEAIASLVLEGAPAAAPPAIAFGVASYELLDAVVRLVRLLERPADAPVLGPLYEREVLWRLLSGPSGVAVRQLGLADSRLAHIGRAVGWIREHYAEAFRVADLARMAGMSVSAFHRNFHAVTSLSPIQFQKRIRLQEARLLLLGRTHDVAGAAFAVGYDSASQFSREYRRQFGAPPGRDAARLRGAERAPALLP